jgi:hypothetical protein
MAIGTGVALAPLARGIASSSSPRTMVGAGWLATLAIALGVGRIAPYVYPYSETSVVSHSRLSLALKEKKLRDAVVIASPGIDATNDLDITENLPIAFYPDQPVLIALERTADTKECLKKAFVERRIYRAFPGEPVRLEELP